MSLLRRLPLLSADSLRARTPHSPALAPAAFAESFYGAAALRRRCLQGLALGCAGTLLPLGAWAQSYPVTPEQRSTAQQVAARGVPLAELAPNAPDEYTVKRGDTLWAISRLFLRSPWRWPELWGMNLAQIRNPHLIYPGQLLVLERSGGYARLRVGRGVGTPGDTVRLSPRVRAEPLDRSAIASIPLHLIGPFLNEAIVLNTNELDTAPRIVATQEGRVLLSKGETAYVRGELNGQAGFRLFREARPLKDPLTKELLGYEGRYVGTAQLAEVGQMQPDARGEIVPHRFTVESVRIEAGLGDRLANVGPTDLAPYVPHAPAGELSGAIVSVYGEAVTAGQNQIVAINRGSQDGVERGHVLALWRAGAHTTDKTDPKRPPLRLPDERHGNLFVFRVFDRVSYALIIDALHPVSVGDRFSQP